MNEILQKFEKMSVVDNKTQIIKLFMNNVKNKEIIFDKQNSKHCGKEGHWLETQMNIKHNSKNEADIFGYEMKKNSSKITFGDFSASEYLFSNKKININHTNKWNDKVCNITKTEFIQYFGKPNPLKNDRYSWSGKCVPVYNKYNSFGQILKILENNDICIYYSFSKDERDIKQTFPEYLHKDNILIVIWNKSKLEQHINNKFNNNGFFICKKDKNKYSSICFGRPFNFEHFITNIKNNKIIFDSGMYEGNTRNYSQFRSTYNNFWNELIIEEYSSLD
jgi:hypothetical protein